MNSELSRFTAALSKVNLCTFFILPLINLSKDSTHSYFRNTYLSPEGDKAYLEISIVYLFKTGWKSLPEHKQVSVNGKAYLEFMIPEERWPDVQLFILGKYSKMSEAAKALIKANSTLHYKHYNEQLKTYSTDYRLLALDKSEKLKAKWESLLFDSPYCGVLDDDMELLSPPPESSFLQL